MLKPTVLRTVASVLAVLFGFSFTYLLIYRNNFTASEKQFDWSVSKIGNQMLQTGENGYALPFEVVSILLLAAMVGCIVIAMKTPAPSQPSQSGKAIDTQGPTNLEIHIKKEIVE